MTSINKNIVINIIRTVTMLILSFITFPWICRVLGDSGLGTFTWISSFIYYFLVLAKISIPNIAIRECSKVKDNPSKFSIKVQEFFILQSVTTLLSFGLMCIMVFSIPEFKTNSDYIPLVFLLSLNFLVGVFSFEWVYIALEKHTYMAIRSILFISIVNILIIVFIKRPEDIELYGLLSLSLTILTVISNLIYLPKHVKFIKDEPYNFKQYYKLLLTLLFITIVVALYNKTDTFILGFIDETKSSVGSYAVGIKGVEIIIGIIVSLGSVFIPRASRYCIENEEKFISINKFSTNITLFITIPATALMIVAATPITNLISGSYEVSGYKDANYILIALASLMITFSLSEMIYTQILIPLKKEKIYMYTLGIGVLLNISLSLLFALVLFKDSPGLGVAIATSITDLIILTILIIFTWHHVKNVIFNLNTLKIIIGGIIIAVVAIFISPLLYNFFINYTSIAYAYILQIISLVFICGIIYILFLILTKEKLVSNFITKLGYKK